LLDESPQIAESILNFFSQLPSSFSPLQNTTYMRFFRPILSCVFQIQELIDDHNVDQIILNDGSYFPFITLKGGEGEGQKHYYKSSWLYNYFIYSYFNDKINITWNKKKNKYIMIFFHKIRELYYAVRFFRRLLYSMLKK